MLTLLAFATAYLKQFEFFKKFLPGETTKNLCNYPPEWHVELFIQLNQNIRKILFVGDVHGCCDELNELLELARVYESGDVLVVFAGDICNKGPMNLETIRLIRELGSMAYCVRGNHEQAVLSRLKSFDETTQLPKKYLWIAELSAEDKLFLERLPFTISIPLLNVIVVHGGLVPGVKLLDQSPGNMLNMRNYIQEKLSGSKHIDEGLPWGSQWPGPQFVIFGHDARRRLQKYRHAIGLDTGCLYGGKLTGFLVDVGDENPLKNGRFLSVNSHSVYVKP